MKTLLPVPENEQERLRALRNYEILDSLEETEFDRLTKLASIICETPISAVSLIDIDRQWFKSSVGLSSKQTPREQAFCAHTIIDESILEVKDATADNRFKNNPLVTGSPDIRFYAGAPLIDPQGYALGSLCVIDTKPKALTDKQKQVLSLLADEAIALIVERRQREELRNFEKVFNLSNDLVFIGGIDGYFKKINPAFTRLFGWSEDEILNTSSFEFYHPDDIHKTAEELQKLADGKNTINFLQRFKTKSGDYKTIEWTSSPEPGTGNIFGIGRDVSELVLKDQQLAASEERLRVFFQNSLGMMFTHDLEGGILSINNAGAAVLGYSREELLGMTLYDISITERRSAVDEYLQKIKEEGHMQGQTSTRHKDGSVRIWMYNNVLENSTTGEPYVIVNGMDITNRYNLERDLKRTTRMLEQTNKVARVGGWEYDIEKQTIYWSSVTKEIHGVPPDYKPDLESGLKFYDREQDRRRIKEALAAAMTNGTPWDQERQLTTVSGEKIWVRSIGNAEFENGICKRLFGTFQDINDFKSAEFALQRSLEAQEKLNAVMLEHIELIEQQDKTIEKIQEFKFLADSIPQMIWTAGPDGTFDYYNQHWFNYTGMSFNETLAKGWQPVLNAEGFAKYEKAWAESLSTGKPLQMELRFRRATDGAYKWHLCRALPMKDDRGKITKWFGSCTDIDEYKRALDLENRISQFEDFNRIVAHNLRGPAGSIDMILGMMAEADSEEEKSDYLTMLKQSSTKLIDTLNELMKVLEVRNNQNLPYDDCDFGELTTSIEQMLKGQILSKNAVINTNFEVKSMKFPKMYLESIFYNMISNALKYSKADVAPVIDIHSKAIDDKIILTFSDNGLGIDMKRHANNIFKLNHTFHTGFDSKGIGLFMTKTQIETFGGKISVESEPNVGTTFTIVF
ncbi:PAS domain S-box protein [Mucilaginibacter sp. L3T2-6]|uniref:PAS domain S-box protein n=1 Tax=Mucilaginibacter sp. L3T2-6 TaxID=3062491 RepID=UPI0026775B7F|nr:PAS domain S-box protein [Mucilaginibacter sp. L3T2-6]MDO3640472.1 PAS domain S-box protein [Mucilaginibacter sp. L3T2-6]MDV6213189.1 PAS domain S-box protein [Mucilaginibacter sp. L3T2-6]